VLVTSLVDNFVRQITTLGGIATLGANGIVIGPIMVEPPTIALVPISP
jgi:hypothetical protein